MYNMNHIKSELLIYEKTFENKYKDCLELYDYRYKPYIFFSYFFERFPTTSPVIIVTDNLKNGLLYCLLVPNSVLYYINENEIDYSNDSLYNKVKPDLIELKTINDIYTSNKIKNFSYIIFENTLETGILHYTFYMYLKLKEFNNPLFVTNCYKNKEMLSNFYFKIPNKEKYELSNITNNLTGLSLIFPKYYPHKDNIINTSYDKILDEDYLPTSVKYLENYCRETNDNWTLVTAYFDLTIQSDSNSEIKARNKDFYFNESFSLFNFPYNLIVFCDLDNYHKLVKLRPKEYKEKTKYIIKDFNELFFDETSNKKYKKYKFKNYIHKIKENRKGNPIYKDNRNIPSYYMFCMSRYIFLKEAMISNHFNSTHFAWINICIQRMGLENIVKLPDCLSLNRDKFSCAFINYYPKSYVDNSEYFYKKGGPAAMCNGFFTANKTYMKTVCDLMEIKFLEILDRGFGHSDEQLLIQVFFDNRDNFEPYNGDYYDMITNYSHKFIYNQYYSILEYFIPHSYIGNDCKLTFDACHQLWRSHVDNYIYLPDKDLKKCLNYLNLSLRTLNNTQTNYSFPPIFFSSFKNKLRYDNMIRRFDLLDITNYIKINEVESTDERIQILKNRAGIDDISKTSIETMRIWAIMLQNLDGISDFLNNYSDEYCIIMEDDIHLHIHFKEYICSVINTMKKHNLNLILLGYLLPYQIDTSTILHSKYYPIIDEEIINNVNIKYHKYPSDLWGNQVYIISRSCAKTLLQKYKMENLNKETLLTFSPDHTITKLNASAIINPMIAVEEGINNTTDSQHFFHRSCFDKNYNKYTYI